MDFPDMHYCRAGFAHPHTNKTVRVSIELEIHDFPDAPSFRLRYFLYKPNLIIIDQIIRYVNIFDRFIGF